MKQRQLSRNKLALLLAGLAMFGPFAIDTMFPAFPVIAAQLQATPVGMQQTISVYLIAYALMSLVHGPLSDALGRRPVILTGVGLFILASVGCALSTSLPTLLLFRALQGVSAGAGMVVGRAIIRDVYSGAEAQQLMSTVSMIFGIAPAVAPIIGGWIIAFGHWSMIFWFIAAFALLLWLASLAWLPETHEPQQRVPLSLRSIAGIYQLILSDRVFLPLALAGTLNFNAMFLYVASAPAFVFDVLGLGEQQFAWLFVPTIAGLILGSFMSGRLAGRLSPTATIRASYMVMLAAAVLNVALALLLTRPLVPWSVLPIGLHTFGIGLGFPALTLLLLDRYPDYRGSAASLQAFVSLTASTLIAGVVSPLLSHAAISLALGAALLTLGGFLSWRRALRLASR